MNFRFTKQKKNFSFVSEISINQIGELAWTTLRKRSLMLLALSFILLAIASCGGNGGKAVSPIAAPPPLPTPPQPPTTSNGHFRSLNSVIGTSSRSVHPLDGASSPTVSMTYARYLATATLLSDGRVLVAGGLDDQVCDGFCNPSASPSNYSGVFTAEVFDPLTETFTLLDSKMSWGRVNHCAVTLPDNRVVLIGGVPMSWQSPVSWDLPPTVDVFDPATNAFTSQVLSGPLPNTTGAGDAQCFLLSGNRILINTTADGFVTTDAVGFMMLDTTTWQTTALPWSTGPRPKYSSATQTPDGKVWIVGGQFGEPGNEVSTPNIWWFDPVAAKLSIAGELIQAREVPGILSFADNSIEVYGGGYWDTSQPYTADATRISSIERIDPIGIAAKIGDLPAPKATFTAVMLQNGKSLHVGGADPDGYPNATQYVFDETTHVSAVTGNMVEERAAYGIAPLASGRVLIVGGHRNLLSVASKTAEIFEPDANIYVLLPKTAVQPGEFMQLSAESSTPDNVTWATRFGTISTTGGYTAPLENPYGSASQVTTVKDEVSAMLPTGAQAIATITVQFPANPNQ